MNNVADLYNDYRDNELPVHIGEIALAMVHDLELRLGLPAARERGWRLHGDRYFAFRRFELDGQSIEQVWQIKLEATVEPPLLRPVIEQVSGPDAYAGL